MRKYRLDLEPVAGPVQLYRPIVALCGQGAQAVPAGKPRPWDVARLQLTERFGLSAGAINNIERQFATSEDHSAGDITIYATDEEIERFLELET